MPSQNRGRFPRRLGEETEGLLSLENERCLPLDEEAL